MSAVAWDPWQREVLEALGHRVYVRAPRAADVVPDDPLAHALLRAAGRAPDAGDAANCCAACHRCAAARRSGGKRARGPACEPCGVEARGMSASAVADASRVRHAADAHRDPMR